MPYRIPIAKTVDPKSTESQPILAGRFERHDGRIPSQVCHDGTVRDAVGFKAKVQTFHSLRSTVLRELVNAGVSYEHSKILAGHKLTGRHRWLHR